MDVDLPGLISVHEIASLPRVKNGVPEAWDLESEIVEAVDGDGNRIITASLRD